MVDSGVPTLPDLSHPRAGPALDLIASKLPPTRPGTIRRASLIERLTRDDGHPIVSVIAPQASPGWLMCLVGWRARWNADDHE
jgi:hypothetical protein